MFFRKNTQKFPKYVDIDDKRYLVEILFFDKKSSSVSLNDNKLVFRMSDKLSKRQLKESFDKLINNISKQIGLQTYKSINKYSDLEFPKSINIGDNEYLIEIIFSKKRSSSVSVQNNKLTFRMSSYLSKKQAQEHFAELLKKIHKKVEKKPIQQIVTIKDVIEQMQFNFANNLYKIEYTTKVRSVKYEENVFYINPRVNPQNIEKYIIKQLIEIYTPRIINYVKAINSNTYNFNIGEISLKLVSSKWGHCTHDNNLMFNIKLLNAPIEVLDYVIIHELAHIKHKNHSNTYWLEVSRFCNSYKMLRKRLKDNPPQLFIKIE